MENVLFGITISKAKFKQVDFEGILTIIFFEINTNIKGDDSIRLMFGVNLCIHTFNEFQGRRKSIQTLQLKNILDVLLL